MHIEKDPAGVDLQARYVVLQLSGAGKTSESANGAVFMSLTSPAASHLPSLRMPHLQDVQPFRATVFVLLCSLDVSRVCHPKVHNNLHFPRLGPLDHNVICQRGE